MNAAAAAMWAEDRATRALGIHLDEVRPGYARMSMKVGEEMANGHGTCHGGFIFALADSAFAFACNSHGPRSVAAAASIDFVAPARVGEVLAAEAVEVSRRARSGVYDVRVTNPKGELVALFRGKSAVVKGS